MLQKTALSKFMLILIQKEKINVITKEYPINEMKSFICPIRHFPDWPFQFCITQFSDRDKFIYS